MFYGGNGSGNSTILNVISSKLNAIRKNKLEKMIFLFAMLMYVAVLLIQKGMKNFLNIKY